MTQMANSFNAAMDKIKKQAKKDRAHAEAQLKNGQEQDKVNKKLEEQTKAMKLDAADALRDARADFAKRLAGLSATVVANDKKADKQIKSLTGIVDADAANNAAGREALRDISEAK